MKLAEHLSFEAQQAADYAAERAAMTEQLSQQQGQIQALGGKVKLLEDSVVQLTQERDFFKKGFQTCSAKRSKKCWVLKIFTAGMAPCK